MQGPHTSFDSGLVPAPGDRDLDPASIITTYRDVQVHTEGRWVRGMVLAWHRDGRGWRCVLDWTPGPGRHLPDLDPLRPSAFQPKV